MIGGLVDLGKQAESILEMIIIIITFHWATRRLDESEDEHGIHD